MDQAGTWVNSWIDFLTWVDEGVHERVQGVDHVLFPAYGTYGVVGLELRPLVVVAEAYRLNGH